MLNSYIAKIPIKNHTKWITFMSIIHTTESFSAHHSQLWGHLFFFGDFTTFAGCWFVEVLHLWWGSSSKIDWFVDVFSQCSSRTWSKVADGSVLIAWWLIRCSFSNLKESWLTGGSLWCFVGCGTEWLRPRYQSKGSAFDFQIAQWGIDAFCGFHRG